MRKPLMILLAAIVIAAALQVGNQFVVHRTLCVSPLECSSVLRPAAIDAWWRDTASLPAALRSDGLHAVATTALIRRACDPKQWTVGFGVRIELEPFAFGDAVSSDGGCLEAGFDAVLRGELVNTRVRQGDCSLILSPLTVEHGAAEKVNAVSALDANAAAACGKLLSADPAVAELLNGSSFELGVEYAAVSAVASARGSDSPERTAGSFVRSVLESANIELNLALHARQRDTSIGFSTAPASAGAGSPQLTLSVRDNGLLANVADVGTYLGTSGQLEVSWNLDHEPAAVVLNGASLERAPQRYRGAGRTDLAADGCASGSPASLFFVEADDEGKANDDQLNAVFEAVEAGAARGVIVAVFVHGWQHSAKPADPNVCEFAALIGSVEQMEGLKPLAQRRAVLGVYVGWPGALYPEEVANAVSTFWNRLDVADRLGGEGAVLPRLMSGIVERLPANANAGAGRSSAFVVAGHSLGGRAVFAAVRGDIVDDTDAPRKPDLVLLLNPAFSADIYAQVNARRCTPGVPLLSFSSRTDGVTRQVYPAGRSLTYPFANESAPPFIEYIYTAANYESYVTHTLRIEPAAGMPAPPKPGDEQTILRGPQRVPLAVRLQQLYDDEDVKVYGAPGRAPDEVWYTMHLEPVGASADCTPEARVIEVDPLIVPSHGEIFSPSFMEYLVRALNKSLGPRR